MTDPESCAYDEYSQVAHWSSVADFCAASWSAGVHVLELPGGRHLDVQVGGDLAQSPGTRAVPVFFSGAVVPRTGKTGPFFSGSGIAERLSSPFIALSDPLVDESADLPLGWYTGRAGENVQDIIARILRAAQARCGELVLVGGSGGGFASILFADRIGASAFAWNPQTDLLMYAPPVVRQYLENATDLGAEAVLATSYNERSVVLAGGGIQHSLTAVRGPGVRRLAYMQSASDWHVGVHAKPFLAARQLRYRSKGIWSDGAGTALLLADFSPGHTPPPYQALLKGLEVFLDPSTSPGDLFVALQSQNLLPDVDEDTAPRDLLADRSLVEANLNLTVGNGVDGQTHLALDWGALPKGYGGITATFHASQDRLLVPAQDDPYAVALDSSDTTGLELSATLYDGLGQRLCTVPTRSSA